MTSSLPLCTGCGRDQSGVGEFPALSADAPNGVRVEVNGNIEGGTMIRRCEDKFEVLEEMFEDHESFRKIHRLQRAHMPVSGSRSSIRAARRSRLAKGTKKSVRHESEGFS